MDKLVERKPIRMKGAEKGTVHEHGTVAMKDGANQKNRMKWLFRSRERSALNGRTAVSESVE
jgi:hypothetical protein